MIYVIKSSHWVVACFSDYIIGLEFISKNLHKYTSLTIDTYNEGEWQQGKRVTHKEEIKGLLKDFLESKLEFVNVHE